MTFSFRKALGFGIALYLIMFGLVSAFVGFEIYDSVYMKILTVVVAAALVLVFAGRAHPAGLGTAFAYGIAWTAIIAVLDFAISRQFEPAIFSQWNVLASYAVILLFPMFRAEHAVSLQEHKASMA